MTLVVNLRDPDKAEAFNFTHDGRKMASVTFSDGDQGVTLFTEKRALANDLAQVFTMHAKDSPFLGLLDLMLTAADDPNRDTLRDLTHAVMASADACCPVCGQYRPDEDVWLDIDDRHMCEACADEEAALHASDLSARDLRGNLGLAVYAMTEGL